MPPILYRVPLPIVFTAGELIRMRRLVARTLGFWAKPEEDPWDPERWPELILRFDPQRDEEGFQENGWDWLHLQEAAKAWTICYRVGMPGVPDPGAWFQDVDIDIRADWD